MNKITTIFFLFTMTLSANAGIYSRIDSCERSGERSCIFEILRDIAAQGRQNNCKCSAMKANSVRSQCFMKYESRLMLNGHTVSLTCSENKDHAFVTCMERRKKTDICFE